MLVPTCAMDTALAGHCVGFRVTTSSQSNVEHLRGVTQQARLVAFRSYPRREVFD